MTSETVNTGTNTERGQMFKWTPPAELIKSAIGVAFAVAGLLGVIGFGESFGSLMSVAWPYLGWASWILPTMIDLGILVLTILALVLDLAGMSSRVIALIPTGLAAYTLYLNTEAAPSMVGKFVHGVGPGMWILVIEAGGIVLRRLVGLSHKLAKPEKIRRVLWLIRPLSTLRLWREMRIHQLPSYRAALDRDAARTAVTGRLRLAHGRRWKRSAPLGERIALTLLGRDPEGVRTALDAHTETARLLTYTDGDTAPDTIEQPAPAPVVIPAQPATAPVPAPVRSAAAPKVRQVAGVGKVRRPAALSDEQLVAEVVRMESEALAASGGTSGTSNRAVQTALGVGYKRVKPVLDQVRAAQSAPVPVQIIAAPAAVVEHVNGALIAA